MDSALNKLTLYACPDCDSINGPCSDPRCSFVPHKFINQKVDSQIRELLESIAECLPKMADPDAVPEEMCVEVEITWGQRATIFKLLGKLP